MFIFYHIYFKYKVAFLYNIEICVTIICKIHRKFKPDVIVPGIDANAFCICPINLKTYTTLEMEFLRGFQTL